MTIFPNIIWIFLDKSVFPWDQAWYAEISVELFYKLTQSPWDWCNGMISAFGIKAPGIAWFGQFFVPLGELIGSIETGLLLSVLLTQIMCLILSYFYLLKLTNNPLISSISCLAMPSSSLWVGLTHQYFVEPIQTFAIAWIVLILIFSPEWKASKMVFQFSGAFSLAMIAKITSPLYSFAPIVIIVYYWFKNTKQNPIQLNFSYFRLSKFSNFFKNFNYFYLVSILLAIITIFWYGKNWQTIVKFTKLASSGEASLLYGEKASFGVKILYWLTAFQRSFFSYSLALILFVSLLYIAIRAVLKFTTQVDRKKIILNHFNICVISSVFQIVLVLGVFSLNINEENRYLLPLMPYLVIIIAWILGKINNRVISAVISCLLVFQLIAVNAQSAGLIPPQAKFSNWLYPLNQDRTYKNILEKVVYSTCTFEDKDRYNIVGLELRHFNANSASFFTTKQLLIHGFRCYYTSLGYAENDVKKAWQKMTDLNINYFVTLSPSVNFKIDAFNQISLPILEKIKSSLMFKPIPSIDSYPVLLYKRFQPKIN